MTFDKLKAAVAKHDPTYRHTDSIKSPDYRKGEQEKQNIISMAKELYKKDPQRTMQAIANTSIMEHQVAPPQAVKKDKPAEIASLENDL